MPLKAASKPRRERQSLALARTTTEEERDDAERFVGLADKMAGEGVGSRLQPMWAA
jgi:hypothetical protein